MKKIPKHIREEILQLYPIMSARALALKYKTTLSTIQNILSEPYAEFGKPWTIKELKELTFMVKAENHTWADIGKYFKRTIGSCRAAYRQNKW